MNKADATKIFLKYVSQEYSDVEIDEIEERENAYLFNFKEKDDDFPIDYPVIIVNKGDGEVRKLSYLNSEDRQIIMGDEVKKEES